MPIGLPSPTSLSSRKTSAFCLDTSVIEAAGFRFSEGQLKQLSRQLPPWLELWMPDILIREISQHRIETVSKAVQQIQSGLNDLRRVVSGDIITPESVWLDDVKPRAVTFFEDQLQKFMESHKGSILEPDSARLSTQLFHMYFTGQPPFGGGKDKKHEFPDAAALLTLEDFANRRGVQVITVSRDLGWTSYAKHSKNIYCVNSISELTNLFQSSSNIATEIKRHVSQALSNYKSPLSIEIKKSLQNKLVTLPWRIHIPNSYSYFFECQLVDAQLESCEASVDSIGVWITSNAHDACAIEVPVIVEVELSLEVLASPLHSWRNEEPSSFQVVLQKHHEIKLQIELQGNLGDGKLSELVRGIDVNQEPIHISVTPKELGQPWAGNWTNSPRGFFEDMEGDDVPF
ncbi:PIN_VapC-like domain containing protein [Comamonadaceae bacterium]